MTRTPRAPFSIVLLFAGFALSSATPPSPYSSTALVRGNFNSFEQSNFGNSSHFEINTISPFALTRKAGQLKDEILGQLQSGTPWYVDLIPGVSSTRDEIASKVSQAYAGFKPNDIMGSMAGVCVANSSNDPSGPDNLLIIVDQVKGRVGFLDFGHFQDLPISDGAKTAANFFNVDLSKTKIPNVRLAKMPLKNIYGDRDALSQPMGIATDAVGNFWVADKGNNRVVRFQFNSTSLNLEYKGEIRGLSGPSDVAVLKTPGQPSVLLIANSGANSIATLEAEVDGVVDFATLPGGKRKELKAIWANGKSMALISPLAVCSNPAHPDEFYVAHNRSQILKFRRAAGLGFSYEGESFAWPTDGMLTGMKSDAEGNLFAVDNTYGYLGKLTHDLTPIFYTGGFSENDTHGTPNLLFDHPQYLALGNDSKSLYVSEPFRRWSGLSRLYNWPRFLGSKASFTLDCNTSAPIGDRTASFSFEVTKGGTVTAQVFQVPDDPAQPHILKGEFSLQANPGKNVVPFTQTQLGFSIDPNGTYRVEFLAYDNQYPSEISDASSYWTDFKAADFIPASVTIGNPFFNPAASTATAEFNVNREANITFKIAPQSIAGTPTNADFITVAAKADYKRLESGAQTVSLNVNPADATRISELQPYALWAEIEAVPCGGVTLERFPLSTPVSLYLDKSAPSGAFQPFTVTKINPNSPANGQMPFTFTANDNSANLIDSYVNVYRAGDLTTPVRMNVLSRREMSGTLLSGFWDGRQEDLSPSTSGDYVLSLFLKDLAGNVARINSPSFTVDVDAPIVSLSLASGGASFNTFNGKSALLLFRDQTADVGFSYTDRFPKELVVRFDKINPQDATVVSSFTQSTIAYGGTWPASFRLRTTDFPGDGIYSPSVYGTDQVGNSSEAQPARTIASGQGQIPYLWVNQKPPMLAVKLSKNVIRSGDATELIVSAYNQGSFPGYAFTYKVDLVYGNTTQSGFASGVLDPNSPTAVIPFNHALAPYSSVRGKFAFKVTLQVNLGAIGNSQQQEADLFVDSFPPQLDGTDGQDVPQKFLLSGQVGDPDPTNDQNTHGFENYSVYYKPGQITNLPADLQGWRSANVYVPFHAIDRNGPNAAGFPFSNVADNQEAITSVLGNSVIAYVDGSSAGANLAIGNLYTFLLVAKEKGIPASIGPSNATLRSVKIASPVVPHLEDLRLNGSSSGDLAFDAASGALKIGARVVGGVAGSTGDATIYVYSEAGDLDGDGIKEPIVARLERQDIPVNSNFEVQWDGKDGKGSYVKNGDYVIAVVLEQKGSAVPPSCDFLFSTGRHVTISTPLAFFDGSFGPQKISASPATGGSPGNSATFKYKISKASWTYLQVEDQSGGKLFDIGPEKNLDGAGVVHLLGWNGTDPATHLPVPNGSYRIKPYAVETEGNANKVYFLPSGSQPDYFPLEIADPQGETPQLGYFAMAKSTTGSSDAIWRSKPNGRLWKLSPVTLTAPLQVKITGTQTGYRYDPLIFSGTYSRQHTLLTYKAAVRVDVVRERECSITGSSRSAANGNPVYTTYSWNLNSVPLSSSQAHTISPDIDYNSSTWGTLATQDPSGPDIPISGDWGSGGCGGTGLFGSWSPTYRGDHHFWTAIYANDGTLMDVITTDGSALPSGVQNPTGLFSGGGITSHITATDYRTTVRYDVGAGPGLSESGALATQSLVPGQSLSQDVLGKDFGILAKVVELNGYRVVVNYRLPPGGTITFTKPYAFSETNPGTAPQDYSHVFAGNAAISDGDKLGMPIVYEYSQAAGNGPQHAVTGVPFPFPPQTGCGLNPFPTEAGNMAPIWDAVQNWVYENGSPKGWQANSGCDYVASIPLPITIDPGQTRTLDLSALAPAGVVGSAFLFSDNNSATKEIVIGTQHVLASISGTTLTLAYPVEEPRVSKVAWNPAGAVGDDDPVLQAQQNSFAGYMQVGGPEQVFNPAGLPVSDALPQPFFYPLAEDQDLLANYKGYAGILNVPIPPFTEVQGENWKAHPGDWKSGAWLDASGNAAFHWGSGLTFDSWQDVQFSYIDGSPDPDWDVSSDHRASGIFTPSIHPMATPKRILPIIFHVASATPGLTATNLMAIESANPDAVWEPIALAPGAAQLQSGDNLLGYWRVTNKAGTYHLRLLARDGAGANYQVTFTMKLGTEIVAGRAGTASIASPLKKAFLDFPPGSKYVGMVSIDPTNPAELPGFNLGNVPKGPIVDVTPSGLLFDDVDLFSRPTLRFNLTRDDIVAAGGHPDNLGEIAVYYLNDKTHTLENAQFAATVFELDDPSQTHDIVSNPVLAPSQGLELKGTLNHTSLYGAFSGSSFVAFDPVVSPTTKPSIDLSGHTGPGATQDIYVYVSDKPKWDATAALAAHVAPGAGNAWAVAATPLPFEGENYFFASLGAAIAGSHEPANGIVVVKDSRKPSIAGISILPLVAGANTNVVQVDATLSEPGEVKLYAPQLSGISAVEKTGPGNRATFSVPLTNGEGSPLIEGSYPMFFSAVDRVGNATAASTQSVLVIDRTPPALKVDPVAFTGKITGTLTDNIGLGRIEVSDEGKVIIKTVQLSGASANWQVTLQPSDIPSSAVSLKVVGYDLGGNPSNQALVQVSKLFPAGAGSAVVVYMKETAQGAPDLSIPSLYVKNLSPNALVGFTLRAWVSREENPRADIALDPRSANPCGIRYQQRVSPDNPNVVAIDIRYPDAYSLAPGESTSVGGLSFALHYRNPVPGAWDVSNDWSWAGIGPEYQIARNIAVYDREGKLLSGVEMDPNDAPAPPAGTGPIIKERTGRGLQALYFFHEGFGNSSADLSGIGIPMDLTRKDPYSRTSWIPTGGYRFDAQDHNAIFENRTLNPKLFSPSVESNELSLEAWINPANLSQNSARIMAYAAGDGALSRNWEMLQNGKNLEFRLRTTNSASVSLVTASNSLASTGRLYHVLMNYKPYSANTGTGGMRIYVDGVMAASNRESGALDASGASAWDPSFILAIGNRPAILDRDWQGTISMAAVYASALTEAEIAQNRSAGLREPNVPPVFTLGVTCEDRLIPRDIVDGDKPWQEDKGTDGSSLAMAGVSYARGLGGKPFVNGNSAFLIYDLKAEAARLGVPGAALRFTGFVGRQDGSGNANAFIKASNASRKPTDQDWLNNTGTVIPLFTSNGGTNIPVNIDITGDDWLLLGQNSASGAANPLGIFAEPRITFGASGSDSNSQEILPGLEYSYYEGTWSSLPDFSTLIPIRKGIVQDLDLSPRLSEDNFAFDFRGSIQIPADGNYTFFLASDDGSRLYLDGQQVIDNNGIHAEQEISGTIFLTQGMHAMRVTFFEATGGQSLKLSYQGPGIPKTRVPPSAFSRPGSASRVLPDRIQSGLQALYDFRDEIGHVAYDVSNTGIPLDLDLVGSNAAWIEGGGIAFQGTDHNTVMDNLTPNPKLYTAVLATGEFTIEAWIEPGDLGANSSQRILEFGNRTGNGDRNFSMSQEGKDLEFALRTSNSGAISLKTAGSPLGSASKRYHLVMTYRQNSIGLNGGMRIYVNSVLQASNQESGKLGAAGAFAWAQDFILAVGNTPGSLNRDWSGKIYLAAVYNRLLTPEQIRTNYNAGIPARFETESIPLGVTDGYRLLPSDIVDGSAPWQEDKFQDGSALAMAGVNYGIGLSGMPRYNGSSSALVYNLVNEAHELNLPGAPLRLTGFCGRQDGLGDVKLSIKTSTSDAPPTFADWIYNTGDVTELFSSQNGANAAIDLDISRAKWIWLGQSTDHPENPGTGMFGQLKAHFGYGSAFNMRQGVLYSYYGVGSDLLPDFDSMSPDRTGISDGFDITQAVQSDNFAFEFKGFIQIPVQGAYTFYAASDDGSRLFIDGKLLVDNDGIHALREYSGTTTLAPGFHAIKVQCFQKTGSSALQIQFQGPGVSKRNIPANLLFHSGSYDYGIDANYYEGTWDVLPDFSGLKPVSSDVRTGFKISPKAKLDGFGFVFLGQAFFATAGSYTFFSSSDDGSRIYIDGSPVVDNDGIHPMVEKSGSVSLTSGFHAIRVEYFEKTGSEGLDISFQGPGYPKMTFPRELLFRGPQPLPNPVPSPCSGIQCEKDSSIVMGAQNTDANYSISGTQWFKIPLSQYAQSWPKTVVVSLDDMNGKLMEGKFQLDGGAQQDISGWYQAFRIPYTGQGELLFNIQVPESRLYKVRWWFDSW